MLRALAREIGYAYRGSAAALRDHGLGTAPRFRALMAGHVGMVLYFPEFSTLRGLPGVYVQDLYVAPDARGGGLARQLLGAVLRDAGDWGAGYMRLSVHRGNAGAVAFYARLGFTGDPDEQPLSLDGAALARLREAA